MRALFLAALLTLSTHAAADTNITVFCNYGYDCGGYYPPFYVNPFDDRIFQLDPPAAPSKHPAGDELDYNSAQRKAWIEACRPQLKTSFAAFQSCFRQLQARNAEAIQRQREAVQNRPAR